MHQVRGEFCVWVPAGETFAPARDDPCEAALAHEPFDTLAADGDGLAPEDGVHAG
ncbi:hypothetical protein GCM10010345_92890 [Streptomyces canarius]|uniref:Uncharacterized protein n=1 Tax=Streptomyces canarius TaxID=285453 RepID=A0ABQ3DIM7_9ACTN|nr:hypothetical protein GCM10010345_92890 [Streptomyces canarius]